MVNRRLGVEHVYAKRTTVMLTPDHLEWLKSQPDGISKAIRRLIEGAQKLDKRRR